MQGPEKGLPYLPILAFNGRPLLAVGSVEIRWGGVVLLFGAFSHLQSAPQPGQEEEGKEASSVTTPGGNETGDSP